MSNWLDAVLVLLMLTSLWLLGSSRLQACIRAVALQGALLGLIPLLSKWPDISLRLGAVAVVSMVIKAVVLPALLRRAVREVNVRNEVEPLVGFTTSLLLGIALWGIATHIAGRLPVDVPGLSPLLVPVAIFTVLCGFLLIVSRNTAVMQVIGYLGLENGIYVFGWAFAIEEPLLVEMGVLLDVFVAVFVMGITIHHLSREFDSIETDELASLKD
ncbi:MAG: hydrogenase [Pirellulales bacterium]|nr:hydrogenase [Pirellulales bacterium]